MIPPTRTRRRRPALLAGISTLAAAILVSGAAGPASASTVKPRVLNAQATRDLAGAYVGACNTAAWQGWQQVVGGTPTIISEFLDQRSWATLSDPTFFTGCWGPYIAQGSRLSLAVPMLPEGGGVSLAQEAAGAYDSYFQTLATKLVAQGAGSSYLRVGWEFNGDWQPWRAAANPTAWVASYQRIVSIMRSVPGQHFKFVWSVNYGYTESDGTKLFPGAQYVDYLGLSAYDQGYRRGYSYPMPKGASATKVAKLRANAWKDISAGYRGLNFWASFARQRHVPIVIAEWGLARNVGPGSNIHGGGDDPSFVTQFHAWMLKNNVQWASYWQHPEGWDGQLGKRADGANYLPKSTKQMTKSFKVKR